MRVVVCGFVGFLLFFAIIAVVVGTLMALTYFADRIGKVLPDRILHILGYIVAPLAVGLVLWGFYIAGEDMCHTYHLFGH